MKHTFVRLTYLWFLSLSIAVSAAGAQDQQPTPVPTLFAGATIAEWKGDVHLSLPGQPASNPLRGEQLPAGTMLDTGGGRLLLRLSDGSEVLVRPHTRLQLQQPSFADPSYFQLLLGRIRALINKRTGGVVPFELGTPSAVIAVRGTQFEVEVNRRSVTEVDVIDGLVEVSGRSPGAEAVLLEPGFSTRVGLDSGPEQPEPTNEMRPEVERPEFGEGEIGEKAGLQGEFDQAGADQEVDKESSEISAMGDSQENSQQSSPEGEIDKAGSEPQ